MLRNVFTHYMRLQPSAVSQVAYIAFVGWSLCAMTSIGGWEVEFTFNADTSKPAEASSSTDVASFSKGEPSSPVPPASGGFDPSAVSGAEAAALVPAFHSLSKLVRDGNS